MSKHFSLYNINKKGSNSKPAGFNFGSGANQSSRSNPSSSASPSSSIPSNTFNSSDEIDFKQSQFKYPTNSNVASGDSSLNKKRTFVSEPDSPSHGTGPLQHSQNKTSKQKFSVHAPYSDSHPIQSDHQRPGTASGAPMACAPPKLSFPRPASDSGSTGTLGNNPFYQNHNEPVNPLSLIFQSSHQMQQEALSVLLARQADLEKIQKQKNSLTRELESAKRESEKFKIDAIELKNSLSIQKKWNAVVDIRLKSLVSARDSILHCLQIIRARSHTYQTSIEELEKQVLEVKTECKKQNDLRVTLQNENNDLKKSLSTATSELEVQSTQFSDMKEAIARNSSELSTLIHKLSIDKDSKIDTKFDMMYSLVDQSKGEVFKKLSAIINHNSELEKSVTEFETRLGHIIESSTERQISATTEIQSHLTLSDVQKEAFCKELKDTYTQQLSEKEKKLDEQSLLLAELTNDKVSLSSQVAELTAHSASLQARLDIITSQHSSAILKLQSDLEEGEKLLLSSKITVASLSEQLNASKKETMALETRLLDLNQEILNLKTTAAKTHHELAESATKLSISRSEISSLFKENELLQDRGNFASLIENRLEKVLSVLSMKEEKESSQLRIEMTNLQEKYESLLSQNRELKTHEMTLNKKIEELKKLESEKENLAPEFSNRIADLEKLLQEETRKSEEKSRADTSSIASLREKLTQKEQDLENCKYKADSELKAMKEKTDALQRDLDNLRLNRNMSRSLSDIEAQKTGNLKPSHVSSLAAVKKEAASARLRNSKRGIFKHSTHEAKGNQRKISEKISPSESFDLFEAPF